jgi:hypothetical protein
MKREWHLASPSSTTNFRNVGCFTTIQAAIMRLGRLV